MRTSELEGAALDWAVAKCEGYFDSDMASVRDGVVDVFYFGKWSPSTDWSQGGAIIEREWLDITPYPNEPREDIRWQCQQHDSAIVCIQYGQTPLIAAMRCYVASKLGDEVQLPEELTHATKTT